MKRVLLITLFAIMFGSIAAQAQVSGTYTGVTQCFENGQWVTVHGNCPDTGGSSSGGGSGSSPVGNALSGAAYQLGYNFGRWLFGGSSNSAADALRQQQQQMMEEVRRRAEEAERLHQEEEAQRLAAMYNRLAATLKLSGLPHLELKTSGIPVGGLQLKLGDSATGTNQAGDQHVRGFGEGGVPGIQDIYQGGPSPFWPSDKTTAQPPSASSGLQLKMGDDATGAGQAANINQPNQAPNSGQQGYGIPGLPGIYAGGPGSGSALPPPAPSGLQLKMGDSTAATTAPAAGVADSSSVDFNKMTPQQLADLAEAFSKLPPEQQQRIMDAALAAPAPPQPAPPLPANGSTAIEASAAPVPASPPVITPQTAAQPIASLQQQANASQAAAVASTPEEASELARSGFDTPLGPVTTNPATVATTGGPSSAPAQAPPSAAAGYTLIQAPPATAAGYTQAPPSAATGYMPIQAPPAPAMSSTQASVDRLVTPIASNTPGGVSGCTDNLNTASSTAERHYICVGNGLIGGVTWILYASRTLGEPEQRMCDAIKHQAMIQKQDYDLSVDCKQYQFVLGMAASLDPFTDVKIRVAFDDLTKGRFSAQEQLLYEKLRGKQFNVLGCHSNGAMICLAALENKDIKAANVVLYGPQVTRESLEMWNNLVQTHQVDSVKVYINENDPVPGASITYADQFQEQRTGANALPKNPSLTDVVGVAAKSAAVAVDETINVAWSNPATKASMDLPLFNIDALKRTINETSPRLLVQTFPCGHDLPTTDCHVLSMYRSTVGCSDKSSGLAVPGTAIDGKDALPEPPLPCAALGVKP